MVSTPRATRVLPLREIDWIEAADNYARLWMGGRSYLLRESLGQLERRVGAHGFARAHRQALVRIAGVRALQPSEAGEIVAVLACGAKSDLAPPPRGILGRGAIAGLATNYLYKSELNMVRIRL